MESQPARTGWWIAVLLCVAVAVGRAVAPLVADQTEASASPWSPLAAAVLAAAGSARLNGGASWPHARRASVWMAFLLMVWAANGLPFDLLTMTGMMGRRTASGAIVIATVDWPRLATRTLALAAAIILARVALRRSGRASTEPASWYGYAAFALALPYPLLRAVWALGGTAGLNQAGAGGHGYAPLVLAIPWVAAAVLSLLLVPTWHWMPRRLLLLAGWSATVIVGLIGPTAAWALVSAQATPAAPGAPGQKHPGVALWVAALFYGSWFFWAIAAGAATRSYQLRTARPAAVAPEVHGRV